jgi:hypothetical protein
MKIEWKIFFTYGFFVWTFFIYVMLEIKNNPLPPDVYASPIGPVFLALFHIGLGIYLGIKEIFCHKPKKRLNEK